MTNGHAKLDIARVRAMIDLGYSTPQIATDAGVDRSSAYRFCKRHGLIVPRKQSAGRPPYSVLADLCKTKNKVGIVRHFKTTQYNVNAWLKHYQLTITLGAKHTQPLSCSTAAIARFDQTAGRV